MWKPGSACTHDVHSGLKYFGYLLCLSFLWTAKNESGIQKPFLAFNRMTSTLFLSHLFLGLLLGPAPTVVTFGEAIGPGYCASSRKAWSLPKSISLHNPFIPSSCVSTKPKKPCGGELGMGLPNLKTSWNSVGIC